MHNGVKNFFESNLILLVTASSLQIILRIDFVNLEDRRLFPIFGKLKFALDMIILVRLIESIPI